MKKYNGNKLIFSNPYNFATQYRQIHKIFQTMNSFRLSKLSLKDQRFTPSGFKDLRSRK